MRPGPASIPPGECAGGWVVHVYDHRGVLVMVRPLSPGIRYREPEVADLDATFVQQVAPGPSTLVVFDGDTGERWGTLGPHELITLAVWLGPPSEW